MVLLDESILCYLRHIGHSHLTVVIKQSPSKNKLTQLVMPGNEQTKNPVTI